MDECLSPKEKLYSSPQAHTQRHSGEKRYSVFREIQAHLHCWSTVSGSEKGEVKAAGLERRNSFMFHTKMLELYPGSFSKCSPGPNHQKTVLHDEQKFALATF